MGRICSEVQEWIEQEIEQPVETFVGGWQQVCQQQDCNLWCLCCNQWLCWLAWVVVRVVTFVVVTIGKWVTRIACESINIPLDIIAFFAAVILSIPIIGGILRTVWNWMWEIVWRLLGFPEFVGSLTGIRLRKKMYFGVVLPVVNGEPIASEAEVQRQADATVAFYDATCNINMIFTGICKNDLPPPEAALTFGCNASGFFNDWWAAGSYFEFATETCKWRDGFRRIIGLGAELVVFVAREIEPATTNGCSFGSAQNYVVIEARPGDQAFVMAHEIGHACWLPHAPAAANLMNSSAPVAGPVLTATQIALVRWSKHCVYI